MTVLAFPKRDKGRVRKRRSVETMGRVILSVLQREGEEIPANVVCIDQPDGPDQGTVDRTEAVMLALSVFAVLSKSQKKSVRDGIAHFARNGDVTAQRILNSIR